MVWNGVEDLKKVSLMNLYWVAGSLDGLWLWLG